MTSDDCRKVPQEGRTDKNVKVLEACGKKGKCALGEEISTGQQQRGLAAILAPFPASSSERHVSQRRMIAWRGSSRMRRLFIHRKEKKVNTMPWL